MDKSLETDPSLDHIYWILIWQTNLIKIIQWQENFVQARELCPVVMILIITLIHSAYYPVTIILQNLEQQIDKHASLVSFPLLINHSFHLKN